MIGQSELSPTELLLQDAVLLSEIVDDRILLAGNPSGHSGHEDLPWLEHDGHRLIVASRRNNRELSVGDETG